MAAMRILQGEERGIVFVTAEALLQKLPIPQKVLGSGVVVTLEQQLEQQELLERLVETGIRAYYSGRCHRSVLSAR